MNVTRILGFICFVALCIFSIVGVLKMRRTMESGNNNTEVNELMKNIHSPFINYDTLSNKEAIIEEEDKVNIIKTEPDSKEKVIKRDIMGIEEWETRENPFKIIRFLESVYNKGEDIQTICNDTFFSGVSPCDYCFSCGRMLFLEIRKRFGNEVDRNNVTDILVSTFLRECEKIFSMSEVTYIKAIFCCLDRLKGYTP